MLLVNYPTNIDMLPPCSLLVSPILPLSHPFKLCLWALLMLVQRSFFHLWEGWPPLADSSPVVSCKLSHDENPMNFCLPVKSIMENGWGPYQDRKLSLHILHPPPGCQQSSLKSGSSLHTGQYGHHFNYVGSAISASKSPSLSNRHLSASLNKQFWFLLPRMSS